MARTRPPYPPEFRREAIRLLRVGIGRPSSCRRSWGVPSRRCVTGCGRMRRIVVSAVMC